MKTLIGKAFITLSCCLALLAFGGTALAGEASMKVRYSDLDLARPEDVAALYERIRQTADRVCQRDSAPWDGRHIRHANRCIEGAVELAVKDVNHVALTSLHEGHGRNIASR